jgi:hypothetical protein
MKTSLKNIMIVSIVFTSSIVTGQNAQTFFNNADEFFKKNVDNGRIDYESIKGDPEELNKLVEEISNFDLSQLQKGNEEKAYLINVYNLLVVKAVLNNYPLKSVMDVERFFDNDILSIAGQEYSLNKIEKSILFKSHPDPRLHFVLVCAAIGCPQIINNAYYPDQLEQQLQKRTQITLNDEQYIRVEQKTKTVFISELFKWYKKDFTATGLSVIEYINQYRENKIPVDYKIDYITYDWTLNKVIKKQKSLMLPRKDNLQAYTPSTLLKPGQIEIKLFNNLYTQTAYYDEDSKKKDQNSRSTYFTGIINSLYGISSDINIGLDIYIKSVRNDKETSSPFSLFKFSSDVNSRTALAQIGPKVKVSPFKSLRSLAFQSTFLIALKSDLDGSEGANSPYLDVDGSQWWTQIFYDYSINNDFLLYFESGFFFRFDSRYEDFYIPLKAFVNYYPSRDWTVYLPLEFTSYWKDSSISAHYSQTGLGGKYQVTSDFELEILYTKFIFGKSQGAGATYNFGVRFIM